MIYRVTGKRRFLGHEPGEKFVGELPPDQEQRAVRLGAIEVIDRNPLTVDLTKTRPPTNWPPT